MTYDMKTPAGRAMRKICSYLLDELEGNFHEVVLIPAPDPMHSGHMVRIVQGQNARWYMKFCQTHVSIRGRGRKVYKRARTFIRKDQTAATLRRMIAGDFSGIQAARLVEFIELYRANRRSKKRRAREDKLNPIDWHAAGIYF